MSDIETIAEHVYNRDQLLKTYATLNANSVTAKVLMAEVDRISTIVDTVLAARAAGGMALTAEQVEDVRTMLWSPGVTALEAFRRLRALFPATKPAEDSVGDPLQAWKEFLKPKPIGWYSTMTREFATEHFGFPEVAGLLECTHTASDGGTWGWCGGDWELLVYPPAPAVPAEEETKAERCPSEIEGWGCSLTSGHDGDHTAHDQDGPAYVWPASSPVVPASTEASVIGGAAIALRAALAVVDPLEDGDWEHAWRTVEDLEDCAKRAEAIAPTETGPWQTWQEVPEGVKYYGVGDTYFDEPVVYVNRPSVVRHRVDDGKRSSTPDYEVESFAPFAVAEEG